MEVTFQRVRFELSAKAFLPVLDLFQAPGCDLVEKQGLPTRWDIGLCPEETLDLSRRDDRTQPGVLTPGTDATGRSALTRNMNERERRDRAGSPGTIVARSRPAHAMFLPRIPLRGRGIASAHKALRSRPRRRPRPRKRLAS